VPKVIRIPSSPRFIDVDRRSGPIILGKSSNADNVIEAFDDHRARFLYRRCLRFWSFLVLGRAVVVESRNAALQLPRKELSEFLGALSSDGDRGLKKFPEGRRAPWAASVRRLEWRRENCFALAAVRRTAAVSCGVHSAHVGDQKRDSSPHVGGVQPGGGRRAALHQIPFRDAGRYEQSVIVAPFRGAE
jgi:hypothetical protein